LTGRLTDKTPSDRVFDPHRSVWLLETDGKIIQPQPTSGNLQTSEGTFFCSPDGNYLAYLHSDVIDLWHFGVDIP
jgi:hypothetical protein